MASPILVTGGAGYIGSHAVLALRDAGHDLVVLDNLSNGVLEAVPDGVPVVVADIADGETVSALLKKYAIRDILHFAGYVRVEESVADPLKYYGNNTAASRALLDTAIKAGIERFVFSSTAATYGVPDVMAVSEETPTQPINPYGWSKLMTEQMLRDAVAAYPGFKVAILRYFNVAGADPQARTGQRTKNATHLIKVASELATGKRSGMQVFGTDYDTPDGTCVRDYIHVSDLAQAHVDVLDWLARPENGPLGLFNCGYGRGYSVREVLAAMEKASGRRLQVDDAPRRPGDPPALISDARRLREQVGWAPKWDQLDTIISTAFQWEKTLEANQPD
ncbi:UDP-glucose 4-epimerase GalE [Iodidimonas gelatinilytica]|uniref:UDP-glucose 4-epimerase n=1 Tax=Iodidimonas gelatinilytica TaxID=1236966 RepID=A0A5A7N0V0_9PROT|nr:UDP-glucose 4-epimerase GalE [Iodidimonas gelatinilytica]GEQ97641.1 UDP-glucose 4-epimerase GalE [Iodidimonas gelatinilytica]GER01893.1 UDP-glucose 4-epimerase GalE [Iodidimonas gelatinilytica]